MDSCALPISHPVSGLQDFIASDPDKEPGEPPSDKAIRAFIDREYPGFLSKDHLIRLEP